MREILFRGKQLDNGEWVYGSLLFDEEQNEAFIAEHFEDRAAYIRQVIPDTVGQYTGLTDKNGKKIFEGDILEVVMSVGYVVYGEGCFCVQYEGQSKPAIDIVMLNADVSVIGNIHDNPELLKGGEQK